MRAGPAPGTIRLGGVEIDVDRHRVRSDGDWRHVTPKAAAVLQLLIEHHGRTVARRELFDAVWPGSFSSDEVLTQVIAELRRALDDPAKASSLILTVPKRGYRWIGPDRTGSGADEGATEIGDTDASPRQDADVAPPSGTAPRRHSRRALAFAALALIAVVAWAVTAWFAPVPGGTALTTIPITHEPGPDVDPDLSRDGLRVAYVHRAPEGNELRVRVRGSSEFERIATPDGEPEAPAWSPDGTALAYLSRRAGVCEIRIVSLHDGETRSVVRGCPASVPTSVDWTPDGRSLLFSRSASDDVLAGRHVAIHRIGVDGRGLQRISDAHRWLVVDLHPRVSPDGRQIAFIRDGDGTDRVVLVAIDAPRTERRIRTPMWPYRVEWHRDGLLVTGHARTAAELWRIDLDDDRAQPMALEAVGPGMTASGDTLVLEQTRVDDNVWSRALDAPASMPRQHTDATRSELCPRLSPDARTLAYLADQGGVLEVFVQDLAAGTRRKLSEFAPFPVLDLRWSPSGDRLVVVVGSPTGKHPRVLGLDGRESPLAPALRERQVVWADWDRDGSHLLMAVATQGRHELRRVPFPALDREELVVDFSVAAISPLRDRNDLFLAKPGDLTLYRVTSGLAPTPLASIRLVATPSDQWIADGRRIAQMMQVEAGSAARIAWQSLEGGEAPESFELAAPAPPLGRNLDLGAGRLWYAQRDADESDLVEVALAD
jgi:DNA-binding winged helix-turn-helix (wHTH) protein/Tol biopolymer transport system component